MLSDREVTLPGFIKWELVEEKTLSSATSFTFSNLKGDRDLEYYFEINGNVVMTSGDLFLYLLPNGLTTNLKSSSQRWWGNTGDSAGYYTDKLVMTRHSCTTLRGYAHIYAHKSFVRTYNAHILTRNASDVLINRCHGEWNETSTELTSLNFIVQNGNITGTVKLYRKVV